LSSQCSAYSTESGKFSSK